MLVGCFWLTKREIVIITASRFPGFSGDTANYTEIMNELIAIGHRVILVCPKVGDQQPHPNNLTIVRIPFSPPRLRYIDQTNRLKSLHQIISVLDYGDVHGN